MVPIGLSAANQRLFNRSLITGYNLKVTVQILDLNHNRIADVSAQLLDGQVNHSFWEPITYSASLTLLDPDNLVGFDTSSPSDNALYADRMVRIVYSVWSELLPDWTDVPLFTGPVTKVKRDDAILSVEAQGKEALVAEPVMAWTAKTYPKGSKLSDSTSACVIRDILGNKAGETRFDLPEWSNTLAKAYHMYPETVMWTLARRLVGPRSLRQLFYDGRGVARLRNTPTRPSFTFTEDHLLTVPRLDYNHTDIRNAATVKGATPEGKPQLRAHRYLPASNPSSAQSLGRNGVKRVLSEVVEDTTLTTQAQVNEAADDLLASLTNAQVGFEFDSFVIPHIEPGDMFHLSTRDVSIYLRLTEFSIPLKAGQGQTNGAIRRVAANRARIRPRRRR